MYLYKAVPLEVWSGPECSRKLRFPDFTTMAQDGGKIYVSIYTIKFLIEYLNIYSQTCCLYLQPTSYYDIMEETAASNISMIKFVSGGCSSD
jgi:hypothetical protein